MKNILPILGFLVLIGLYAGFSAMQKQQEQEKKQEQPAAETQQAPTIEKKFEDFLNGFLGQVADKAQEYTKQRKIVTELVKPENLATPAYIIENSRVMKQAIIGLNDQMNGLMSLFGDADKQIDVLLLGQPEDAKKKIMESWAQVKKQQGGLYMAFFASEQDILQAHTDLMGFYNAKIQAMQYDPAAQAMAFTDEKDRRQELALHQKIDDLNAQQAILLGSDDAPKE